MARLFSFGAEGGCEDQEALFFSALGSLANVQWVLGSESGYTARTGSFFYRMPGTAAYLERSLPGNPVELYIGFAMRIFAYDASNEFIIIPGSAMEIRTGATGQLLLYRSTTLAATGTGTLALNTWHYMEVRIKPLNSGGIVQVKQDGTLVMDFSGDATNGDEWCTSMRLVGNSASGTHFEDWVINDTSGAVNNSWPGQPKLFPLRVKDSGEHNDLTRAGWDLGHAHAQVREHGAGQSFLEGTTTDHYVLVTLDSVDLPAGVTINNLILCASGRTGGGNKQICPIVRPTTTVYEGDTKSLPVDWGSVQQAWPINQEDSGAWEEGDLQSVQLGVRIK